GTGNMKFMMNGALTIGTLDGANVEIREQVGEENFFLFGHTAEQIERLRASGYRPLDWLHGNDELQEVISLLRSGYFSRGDSELFRPLLDSLLHHDPYFLLADFGAYMECQDQVNRVYLDHPEQWARMSIFNTAHSGMFSSDRTIRQYCQEIWRVRPVPIRLLDPDDIHAEMMQ
ncbi:MAG: glycogen/starch/alpha-glucan phosphorylase, partial [Pseudomonadales bacterium]|nr:glycogen/starch/alpha-glucan phosphorylase [Pseudomonadales bacterium]